jgi:Putative beta barrel porin-7 (BBP7)
LESVENSQNVILVSTMRTSLISLLSVALAANICSGQQHEEGKQPAAEKQPVVTLGEPIPYAVDFDKQLGTRFWGSAEYLLWWTRGQNLPPLATTSPPGTPINQAGVLGAPGTSILIGDSRANTDPLSGGRFTLGYWVDDCYLTGIGVSFFFLGRNTNNYSAASQGDPILARPFFDVTLPGQAAQLTAFPNVAAGRVDVSSSTELLGADVFLRRNICASCCPCNSYRLDAIVGYRYLQLRDCLDINESLTSTDRSPLAPPVGTTFDISDRFHTENYFNGGELGLQYQFIRGRVSFDVLTGVALGCTERVTTINGNTRITLPGQAPMNFPGGVLALETNSGRYTDHVFSVIPEVRLSMGYQVTERLRVFVGYNFLYWNNVVRAGDQVDLHINPNFLPPVVGGDPRNPAFLNRSSGYWAQGISFGVSYNY